MLTLKSKYTLLKPRSSSTNEINFFLTKFCFAAIKMTCNTQYEINYHFKMFPFALTQALSLGCHFLIPVLYLVYMGKSFHSLRKDISDLPYLCKVILQLDPYVVTYEVKV